MIAFIPVFTRLLLLALLFALGGCGLSRKRLEAEFFADLDVLREVCKSNNAGDRVYRRVEEVQGIFKAKVVKPYPDWGDQYGIDEPWATYHVDTDLYTNGGELSGGYYWFVEAPPEYGSPEGSLYRRKYLYDSGKLPQWFDIQTSNPPPISAAGTLLHEKLMVSQQLLSRYAWTAEDLTTKEMRKHWIAGGRLKIFDRISGEILAERVNFYRAAGPIVKKAWATSVDCADPYLNYAGGTFLASNNTLFIKYVLKPPIERPTAMQLRQIKGE